MAETPTNLKLEHPPQIGTNNSNFKELSDRFLEIVRTDMQNPELQRATVAVDKVSLKCN